MTEKSKPHSSEELHAWVRQQMQAAVYELLDRGLFEGMYVEAQPAWVFPFTLLIGRIREQGDTGAFDWFVTGDAPLSHVHSSLAATPVDAARHFALQWQLDAARQGQSGEELARKAEALYELVQQPGLWGPSELESDWIPGKPSEG